MTADRVLTSQGLPPSLDQAQKPTDLSNPLDPGDDAVWQFTPVLTLMGHGGGTIIVRLGTVFDHEVGRPSILVGGREHR